MALASAYAYQKQTTGDNHVHTDLNLQFGIGNLDLVNVKVQRLVKKVKHNAV